MKQVACVLVVIITIAIPTVVFASHNPTQHQLAWWNDAVDKGITPYENGSRYTTAVTHADNTWSGLGRVNIYPTDYLDFNKRLTIGDYTKNDGLCGYENNVPSIAVMWLNTTFMDPANDQSEKIV